MAATIDLRKGNTLLQPEVNKIFCVRNLLFNISSKWMYDIFSKYGVIHHIRVGTNKDTRGIAFVVYEDIYDAKTVVDISGFNVANHYLIVLYYQQANMSKKVDHQKKEDEITRLQENYGVSINIENNKLLPCPT